MIEYNKDGVKDWEIDETKNHVYPSFNNSLGRYTLSIDEVIDSINKSGYPIDGWIVHVPDGNGGTKPLPERLDDIIQNSPDLYRLEIESTNGDYINHPDFTSLLLVTLYRNNTDITENINAKYFKWTRTSPKGNEASDAEWNLRWSEGAKEIPITREDIRRRSVFNCYFVTEKEEEIWVMKAYQRYMILNKK